MVEDFAWAKKHSRGSTGSDYIISIHPSFLFLGPAVELTMTGDLNASSPPLFGRGSENLKSLLLRRRKTDEVVAQEKEKTIT